MTDRQVGHKLNTKVHRMLDISGASSDSEKDALATIPQWGQWHNRIASTQRTIGFQGDFNC